MSVNEFTAIPSSAQSHARSIFMSRKPCTARSLLLYSVPSFFFVPAAVRLYIYFFFREKRKKNGEGLLCIAADDDEDDDDDDGERMRTLCG